MKNYLKDKRVLVGLLVVSAVAYYFYDQKRKAKIKSDAEILADTPATTEPMVEPKQSEKVVSLTKNINRLENIGGLKAEKI